MLFQKSNETIDIKLECDPSPPDEKTVFSIKPVSHLDLKEAKHSAGKLPFDAMKTRERVTSESLKASKAAVAKIRPDLKDLTYTEALMKLKEDDFLLLNEELRGVGVTTQEEFDALQEVGEWESRHDLEVVRRGVVRVSGEECDIAEMLLQLPPSLYPKVVSELASKVREVSELTPAKKQDYVARFGLTTMAKTAMDGSASTAN